MICDRTGTPLVVWTTPANVRDDTATPEGLLELELLEDQAPGLVRRDGARVLMGDRGYGFDWLVRLIEREGWLSLLSPRGADKPHGSGLGKWRYVVERTLAWFGSRRRLKLCYERWGVHFQGFHDLALIEINFKRLTETAGGGL